MAKRKAESQTDSLTHDHEKLKIDSTFVHAVSHTDMAMAGSLNF
jgi:hypothetical protein